MRTWRGPTFHIIVYGDDDGVRGGWTEAGVFRTEAYSLQLSLAH